ncbi:hypothetical protein H5410_009049 [Solanum commersonii]|uniref:Uncharacterized protein n=1 Tax=Solanum commersonii TaxID=4109 RepID=A0A9J6AII1_SOLCO|nr:hypothetical protein H5410_009049 [Solanum commersonii]
MERNTWRIGVTGVLIKGWTRSVHASSDLLRQCFRQEAEEPSCDGVKGGVRRRTTHARSVFLQLRMRKQCAGRKTISRRANCNEYVGMKRG